MLIRATTYWMCSRQRLVQREKTKTKQKQNKNIVLFLEIDAYLRIFKMIDISNGVKLPYFHLFEAVSGRLNLRMGYDNQDGTLSYH